MSADDFLFPLLVVGLEKYIRQGRAYPYPAQLQHALNRLALYMGEQYPPTLGDVLALMELPVEEWWIAGEIPGGFDKRLSLLSKGQLGEMTEEYLLTHDLRGLDIADLQTVRENHLVVALIEAAHKDYQLANDEEEAEHVEGLYAEARRFIIEHSFTTSAQIRKDLRPRYRDLILQMYDPVPDRQYEVIWQGRCWDCPACGALRLSAQGNRQSIKPEACALRCPTSTGWLPITPDSKQLVLKGGVQRRTLIPGKAEIELFDWLKDRQARSSGLGRLTLYPGVDRYDIRLVFADGESQAWAVDVKDYSHPFALAKHISVQPRLFEGEQRSRWQRAFYVVPDHHEAECAGYCDIIGREAGLDQFDDVVVMTVQQFKTEVDLKLWELEKDV